mgnify:FL=1
MNNSISYFIKFFKNEQHADSFLAGDIFANRFSHFKVIENIEMSQSTLLTISDEETIPFKSVWRNCLNIFCVYAGSDCDVKIPKACEELGKFAVIIHDVDEFLNRVRQAVVKNDFHMEHSLVSYTQSQEALESIFLKPLQFDFQQEYRFAFSTGVASKEPLIISIGDISDIAEKCRHFIEIQTRLSLIKSNKQTSM